MASTGETLSTTSFHPDRPAFNPHLANPVPILPSSAPHDTTTDSEESMDITPVQTLNMAPPTSSGPAGDEATETAPASQHEAPSSTNGATNQPIGAAAAAQQPKVVQTAFIHKLYNMLEDQNIQHLISWSGSNDSFVMSPSTEFSKALSQYFKHTNISSFVRQLNMYGFHKVSDVFHTGSPETPLWEFKHGGNNFKRGDLMGLREIKRRASRHALIHRDSFANVPPKMATAPPPAAPMEPPVVQDPFETRLSMMEWSNNELFTRLSRTEEAYTAVTAKCQALLEGLAKSHQWNQELCSHLLSLVPDTENPIHKDVSSMRQDISRHLDRLRTIGDSPQPHFSNKQPFFTQSNLSMELPLPLSPRQRPFDESRRQSLQAARTPTAFRPPVALQAQTSPRRYGSIGVGNGAFSPSFNRPTYLPPPPPPPMHQPLTNTTSPPINLARRHTSADIRVPIWPGGNPGGSQFNQHSSPYASGQSSSAWPSSPRQNAQPGDQQLRDALAQYELPRPGAAAMAANTSSRQPSPPPPHETGGAPSFASSFGGSYANNTNDAGWQLPGARYPFKGLETPGPPTRRSSMASNVHSLLNPAHTAERDGEDEGPSDEKKRKRV